MAVYIMRIETLDVMTMEEILMSVANAVSNYAKQPYRDMGLVLDIDDAAQIQYEDSSVDMSGNITLNRSE